MRLETRLTDCGTHQDVAEKQDHSCRGATKSERKKNMQNAKYICIIEKLLW